MVTATLKWSLARLADGLARCLLDLIDGLFGAGDFLDRPLSRPEALDDCIAQDNPVRFIDAFVDSLDLQGLGFTYAIPAETGRPSYHPGDLLKLYVYGYLNRIRSSRLLDKGSWTQPRAGLAPGQAHSRL